MIRQYYQVNGTHPVGTAYITGMEYVQVKAAVPVYDSVEYGLLYNWPTTQGTGDSSLTSSNDWVIPAVSQVEDLKAYLDPSALGIAGGKLKESGTTYWTSPNTGATNETGFNLRGTGIRDGGVFGNKLNYGFWWTRDSYNSTRAYYNYARYNSLDFTQNNYLKNSGMAVRLLYFGAGTPTSYTGNDGRVYRVVTIDSKIWLADNLCETRLRDGSIIPWYGADPENYFTNAEWAALTTSGCCAYDNDETNVAPGFTFPTS